MIVDAMYIKVRRNPRVISQGVLIAIGVNEHGYREILGIMLGDSESETNWSGFFAWLKNRGLTGVEFVSSDDHGGLANAIRRYFQGVSWQRCQTHLTRNILDNCPRSLREELKVRLKALFDAPDLNTSRKILKDVMLDFAEKAPRGVTCLEEGFDDATVVMALPQPYRPQAAHYERPGEAE